MADVQTIVLPSGKTATIRPWKAKDVVKAQMMAGQPAEMMLALCSLICEIDGAKMVMEDVGEIDGPDFLELLGFFGVVPRTRQASSLPSPDSVTGATAS